MKQRLTFIQQQLVSFEEKLTSFISCVKPSGSSYKKANELADEWSKIIKHFDEVQNMVTPVEALEVKFPKTFTPGTAAKWKMWKDYLAEQHNIFMKSRYEIESLKRLMELADNDHIKASEILSHAMATGYRNFFSPDLKNKNIDQNATEQNGMFISDRY